jgi:hypothetical protein
VADLVVGARVARLLAAVQGHQIAGERHRRAGGRERTRRDALPRG